MHADDELPYVRPQEWVSLVERLQFHVGTGKKKIAGKTIKLIAYRLAWHADYEFGTGVHPGLARTAVACEVDYDTVKRVFAVLREVQLLTLTKASRGPRGRRIKDVADEYRLTIPKDLLDQPKVRVLDPNEFKKEVDAVREAKQGRKVAEGTHPPKSPVDNYLPLELQGCSTPASEPLVEKVAGVRPLAAEELRGDCPESCGGDAPLPTTMEQAPKENTHPPVPAEGPVTRARSRAGDTKPTAESRVGRCGHGMRNPCPFCRREAEAAAAEDEVAKVIPLRPDRSAS